MIGGVGWVGGWLVREAVDAEGVDGSEGVGDGDGGVVIHILRFY